MIISISSDGIVISISYQKNKHNFVKDKNLKFN
jgi:hypothetical protein